MARYLILAAIATISLFMKPTHTLTPIAIPEGMDLPNAGPIEDEPKPKRVRKKKGDPSSAPKPRVQKNKNEREIRAILERITGLKWPSVRPKWLLGVNGRNLEIDMYCKELNISVEHQGQQHLKYTPFFHSKGYQDFEDQKQRDALKAALLRQHGVKFIAITCTEWDHLSPDPLVKDQFLLLKLGHAQ